MAEVSIRKLNKMFDVTHVVKDVDLEIRDKEFVVLVGPSGCGKTTTLRMVAGLEAISSGQILIDDAVVNEVPPMDRDIAMVFQNYALYPHMSVAGNMAFGLKMRKFAKPEIETRIKRAAAILGIENLLERKPRQLSGGQRQRVALGRAIVRDPKVFLFDEPLSNLDAKLRVQMRVELKKLHERLGTTAIYVTHDQVEAMTLGDRVVVMKDGVGPAGRRAARTLQHAGQSFRGGLHRLAGHELHRGHARRKQRRRRGRSARPAPHPARRARRTRLAPRPAARLPSASGRRMCMSRPAGTPPISASTPPSRSWNSSARRSCSTHGSVRQRWSPASSPRCASAATTSCGSR